MKIDVKQFIYDNYTEYLGDESFLAPISEKTEKVWNRCKELLKKENENGGVLDIELNTFSGINNFAPGYIDKDNEVIVGLQTDAPLKRILNPYGGIRMMNKCLEAYGYELPEHSKIALKAIKRSHNDGVFSAYTDEIKKARHSGLITGLPDAYGRGRIIGDYRRVPLYGINALINQKKEDYKLSDDIQLREEISMQIQALKEMNEMAKSYGFDLSAPAATAQEALQGLYFAYLAGAKENNGAATSLGRVSTFIDIYIENDLKNGILNEEQAQELIDQFVIKLRLIRHLRTPEYDELFAGDPTWVTESVGGMGENGKSLVTKTSFRILHTLENLGPAPEPNLTVLWHKDLPSDFKKYCSHISMTTSAIQYENDELMRSVYGEDYGVACCVSGMRLGEQMQFFGARCNIAKALLYAINEGRDENSGEIIVPNIPKLKSNPLDYNEVLSNYDKVLNYVVDLYVQANNIIHYMHDKYAYEASQMALHDSNVEHLMAFGIAGFSVTIDSLSAIKYGNTTAIRDENGIVVEFETANKFPTYGNDDERADSIGMAIATAFSNKLKWYKLYKKAKATLSILTITSNVVYGKKTGATPDGREKGKPFAPGANPMHGRDCHGALASLHSVASIPYKEVCEDGISNTFSMPPHLLGKTALEQKNNLTAILDGYFSLGGHHLNVNIMDKATLLDAIEHPENYPALTIRVSGYAVRFNSLTKEQKLEVINRTFHGEI